MYTNSWAIQIKITTCIFFFFPFRGNAVAITTKETWDEWKETLIFCQLKWIIIIIRVHLLLYLKTLLFSVAENQHRFYLFVLDFSFTRFSIPSFHLFVFFIKTKNNTCSPVLFFFINFICLFYNDKSETELHMLVFLSVSVVMLGFFIKFNFDFYFGCSFISKTVAYIDSNRWFFM